MKIYEKAATTRRFIKNNISRHIFIPSVSDIRYPTFFRFRFVQSRGPLFYCHITSAPVIYVPIWENHVRNKFCLNLILLFIERTNYNNFLWIFSRLHIRRMYSEYIMTIKTQFILYHNNYFSPIKVSKFIISRFNVFHSPICKWQRFWYINMKFSLHTHSTAHVMTKNDILFISEGLFLMGFSRWLLCMNLKWG